MSTLSSSSLGIFTSGLPITSSSSSTSISSTGSWGGTSITIDPSYYNASISYGKAPKIKKDLEDLYYSTDFEIDKNNLLKSNIRSIKKNKIIFKCSTINNRIQPYEFIMKLIDEKKQFSVKIKVSDILTINYVNFRFLEIENNLNFGDRCDFSKLKVKFEYSNILYENHKLSTKQLRTEKIKKIMKSE